VRITWVGHSTVLLEADGARLLTDPLLRPRVAHLRRVAGAASEITGEVDAVLLSHVHNDHLDFRSLDLVRSRLVVVPQGAGRLLESHGLRHIVELGEGERLSIGHLTVVGTHADHRARRLPFAFSAASLGYLIEGSGRLYFAGDTDLFGGMRELARPALDVALLPIDGWGPRVGAGHLDPRRAAEALRLLRPRIAVPIHWGTYRRFGMSRDAKTRREPARRFEQLAAELAPEVDVRVLAPGECLDLPVVSTAAGSWS
jgi:L-ascorbate metabolism protein UlaG (beta-lactamase superfamily)